MAAPSPDPISQRFMQLIQQFGLTKNSFAMSLGKTASVVQHLIEGRNKPGYDLLCKVFEVYPNVSRDWLLLGRGPMLVSGELAPKLAAARPVSTAPELPLTPPEAPEIELVEAPALRRPSHSNGASTLQPADIVATLALAAATAQPARASASAPAAIAEAEQLHEAQAAVEAVSTPAVSTPSSSQDNGLAVALHTQYLQHQLALAEQRNQHLLEQQQLLREMLEMARH